MKTINPQHVRIRKGTVSPEFLEDVRRNGVIHPIALQGNKVFDGHARVRAARKLGLKHIGFFQL